MEIIRTKYTSLESMSKRYEQKMFFFKNYKKGEKINISKTAESLGVSRQTIYNWIKEINNQ